MSVRTRIALGTLCVFNAFILVGLGGIALLYVDGAAGPVSATACWLCAIGLSELAHRLRRSTDWG
ncbi:MAG TPA: hypothetical protein VNY84_11160 [Acidimicrobiales bacterium]|nr:hypothetical protein [Acidimicrobiales bacterium]